MKIRGTFVVLVLIMALMSACRDSLSGIQSPAGKVSLNFNSTGTSNNARTILPSKGNLGDFKVFDLLFTKPGDTKHIYVNNTGYGSDAASLAVSFDLELGTYSLTAIGYLDGIFVNADTAPTGMARPAGTYQESGIVVAAPPATPTAITVTLRAIKDGTGTFSWNVKNSLCLGIDKNGTNTMTITGINGTPAPNIDPALPALTNAASWTGSRSLPAGWYDVKFHLETPPLPPFNSSTVEFSYVFHVYQNWITDFNYTVTDSMADLPDNIVVNGGSGTGMFSPDVVDGQLNPGENEAVPGQVPHGPSFTIGDPGNEITVRFPDGIVYNDEGELPMIEDSHIVGDPNFSEGAIRIYHVTGPYYITVKFSGNVTCEIRALDNWNDPGGNDGGTLSHLATAVGSGSDIVSCTGSVDTANLTGTYLGNPYRGNIVILFTGTGSVRIYDIIIVQY